MRIIISLFLLETIFQITGSLFYSVYPKWLWTICDASMLLIPVLFGLKVGIIALIPNLISEAVWFVASSYTGPLLHAISFLIAVIILGFLKDYLDKREAGLSIPIKLVCFELLLIGEEALYVIFRVSCGAGSVEELTWSRICVDFLSVGNLVCLAIGLAYLKKTSKDMSSVKLQK